MLAAHVNLPKVVLSVFKSVHSFVDAHKKKIINEGVILLFFLNSFKIKPNCFFFYSLVLL